ncbi:MAG: superoxide dismutase [Candidatus Gracilibacteria bacterium]|nr:superoxide dismutase [Candidatus Gracilibacteria bacterium]
MTFELPKLGYAYDALEPFIDAKTMEVHHGKHHQTYTDNFNAVIAKYPELEDKSAEDIIKNINTLNVDEKDRAAIKNQGGGYLNHNIFWEGMGPQKEIDESLKEDIIKTFGSPEEFKKIFSDAALKQFGSGWAWLVRDEIGSLKVYSLPNQDSPLTIGHKPIFCLDVWEHAYYLKYQNRRAEYIENWWSVLKMV